MAVFHELVELFNRTPVDLSVRFDGQEHTLEPGWNTVPKIVVPFAKNQHPVMGSGDPDNPSIRGTEYLVGQKGTKDNCLPLTEEEWDAHLGKPCRLNIDDLIVLKPGERLVRKTGRKVTAYDAHESTPTEFGARD